MAHQFVFTLKDLRKVVPPKREILRGIWLSFFPGAKIGVLGANGAGKSSLLRIMAAVDPDYLGEVWRAPDLRIGHLPQEPRLDPAKDVRGNVEDGVAETRALLARFDAINARFAEPLEPDEMDKLLAEQAQVQDAIEAQNAWELDRTVDIAMDALRVPPGDADVATLSGGEIRRVAPGAPPPLPARCAPARRADEPPGRRVGGLARALPQGVPGHGRRHHPRPVLPRQRGGVDSRAGPRRRHPLGGQLLLVARPEARAAGRGGEAGIGPAAHPRARAGVGADGAAGAPGEVQGATGVLRGPARRGSRRAAGRRRRSSFPPDLASATWSCRPRESPRATGTGCSSRT